jgi:heme a synthase
MAQKPRSIFEDVTAPQAARPAATGTGMIDGKGQGARGAVRLWLVALFLLVVVMIVVGGLTRLTDSGLSITEWQPIRGIIPPMDPNAWVDVFQKYQTTEEFRRVNSAMTLEEFKVIFWWEWAHRALGRVVGLVWAVGFAGFALTRRIPRGWTGRLLLVGALGALQGLIGWLMVASGLDGTRVDVASYMLALHLGLAFAILGVLAWFVFLLGRTESALLVARRAGEPRLFGLATGLLHLSFLQILLGALVAGIDAGRAFPTWPDMNGQFFPADAFYVPDGQGGSKPAWHAFFENPGLVQFLHRMTGYALAALVVVAWLRGRRSAHQSTRRVFHGVLGMTAVQVALGIAAVLTAAHLHVAITHQIGAVILWVLILRARFLARYPDAGSIREGTL